MTEKFDELKEKFEGVELVRIRQEMEDGDFPVFEYDLSDEAEVWCTFYENGKLRTAVFENENRQFDGIKYTFDPISGHKTHEEFYDNGVLITRAYYDEVGFLGKNQIIGVGDMKLEVSPKQILAVAQLLKLKL